MLQENVIRNQLEIDEGDYFNKILHKSINNIKSLNFFKSVNSDVVDGKDQNSKIINFQLRKNLQVKFQQVLVQELMVVQ